MMILMMIIVMPTDDVAADDDDDETPIDFPSQLDYWKSSQYVFVFVS